MTRWVYHNSEPGRWTVGYYDPDGRFRPESDHDNTYDAAARVHYLNGGRGRDLASRRDLEAIDFVMDDQD